ncbi:MAG: sigma-54 dependent transcriptional regulator [Desulfovibrionaceae bacterium]
MAHILIIDDEVLVRTLVTEVGIHLGHTVVEASTLAEGHTQAQAMIQRGQGPDVILLDVRLPDGNGLEHLRTFGALASQPELMVITGHGDGDAAETALRSGAWEYLTKPLRVRELSQALAHILAYRTGRRPSLHVRDMDRSQIIGSSPALMKTLYSLAEAARSDVNVLLLGETGVGKELFAKALYRNSGRAGQPFVTVDCASLTETLVESHLFGHSRGAFTGADRAREGLLLAAHKGTLFLDEVGDLPLSMQGAFLRALELRRFRPIGEGQEVVSDFRLVSATNKNLDTSVKEEQFRSDLLYRLRGMVIHIPPLRERVEDIPELARHAVLRFCVDNAQQVKQITEGCLETLLAYTWQGNVRELFHAMERACVSAGNSDDLYASHLPTELRVAVARHRVGGTRTPPPPEYSAPKESPLPTLRAWKAHSEAEYVERLMRQSNGDVRAAATAAGLSRGHLYELLKKYHVEFRLK